MASPAMTLTIEDISATIWPQDVQGRTIYNTTFQRGYKDAAGKWCNSGSFGLGSLGIINTLTTLASAWITQTMRSAERVKQDAEAQRAKQDAKPIDNVDERPPVGTPTPDPATRSARGGSRGKPRGKLIPQDCGDPTG